MIWVDNPVRKWNLEGVDRKRIDFMCTALLASWPQYNDFVNRISVDNRTLLYRLQLMLLLWESATDTCTGTLGYGAFRWNWIIGTATATTSLRCEALGLLIRWAMQDYLGGNDPLHWVNVLDMNYAMDQPNKWKVKLTHISSSINAFILKFTVPSVLVPITKILLNQLC